MEVREKEVMCGIYCTPNGTDIMEQVYSIISNCIDIMEQAFFSSSIVLGEKNKLISSF